MIRKKVTYIISHIDRAIAFEWICEEINKEKFELSFILLNEGPSYFEDYLKKSGIKVLRINYHSKKSIPGTIFKIFSFLRANDIDIVHTHLFDATFSGLIAAKLSGIKKRIYTRHYSNYHHLYFPKAVKWDKFNNLLATQIVAISEVVYNVLVNQENVPAKKVSVIHHGFKLTDFSRKNRTEFDVLVKKYNSSGKAPVIGVISRLTELKGIQFIIPAFKKLLKDYPDALLLLFNASGDYEKSIDNLLGDLPPDSFKKIVFENNITAVYHIFDVFVHVPINSTIEAFGQTYIEAMASGVPLIATKSGIANNILVNQQNAIVVPYQDSDSIYNALILVLKNREIRDFIVANAYFTATEKFQLSNMINKTEDLYS